MSPYRVDGPPADAPITTRFSRRSWAVPTYTTLMNGDVVGQGHPVVGLGASAGGIKPLKEFLSLVPADADIAWVVILHLSPDHDSKLAEVLQSATSIPVSQVTGRTAIQPNHVYVVPPNKSLEIMDRALAVKELHRLEQRRAPIDVCFSNARRDPRAAPVAWCSPDRLRRDIRLNESRTWSLAVSQIPDEAEYPSMPTSAVATDWWISFCRSPTCLSHRPVFRGRAESAGVATVVYHWIRRASANPRVVATRTARFFELQTGTVHRRIERRLQCPVSPVR